MTRTLPAATRALLERANRITFDITREVYVADGKLLDQALVGDLIESGLLVRVPWTVRHRVAEEISCAPIGGQRQ